MKKAVEGEVISPEDDLTIHVLKNGKYKGLTVEIMRPEPEFLMKMQKVFQAVKMPKPPKYYARTLTGRMEEHYMDQKAAEQTEGGMEQWASYQTLLREAKAEQNEKVTLAIMYFGTKFTVPEDGWEEEQVFLGIEVPQEKNQKRAHFLSSVIDAEDMAAIMSKVMRRSGIDESVVKEAEDSFRLAIHTESR